MRTNEKTPKTEQTLTIEKITPAIAERYLATMKNNRSVVANLVDRYTAEMSAGQWKVTGESIKFNTRGELIDGQHRLLACIRSGITIEVDVRRGILPEAFMNIDTGGRRTPGHLLQVAGFNYTNNIASTIRQACSLLEIDAKEVAPSSLGKKRIAPCLLLEWAEEHQEELTVAIRATSGRDARVVCAPPGLFAALYFLFAQHNPQGTKEFFEALIQGIGFETDSNDPVYMLRKSILALKASKAKRGHHYLAAIVIKAWNAFQNRESIYQLKYVEGSEEWPEINRRTVRASADQAKPRRRSSLREARQAFEARQQG